MTNTRASHSLYQQPFIILAVAALGGCVAEIGDPDDPELSEAEQGLTGAGYLNFDIGYGEGYLSPIPETRTGVADGMVGWVSHETITLPFGGTARVPDFSTKTSYNTKMGDVHLKWTGTVPATGTCAFSAGALLVDGYTRVKGENPFPYTGSTDASALVDVVVRGWVGGQFAYYKTWRPGNDSTKSETRFKYFDNKYYLSSGPSFFAYAGSTVELDIQLHNSVWANSDGEASVGIYQFGLLATGSADIVKITCY